jgi:hypothetical protein
MLAWSRGGTIATRLLMRRWHSPCGGRPARHRARAGNAALVRHQGEHARPSAARAAAPPDAGDLCDRRYLPVLAGATFGEGEAERAAHLFSADALRECAPLPPAVRRSRPHRRRRARRTRRTAFAAAWASSEAMSLRRRSPTPSQWGVGSGERGASSTAPSAPRSPLLGHVPCIAAQKISASRRWPRELGWMPSRLT